MCLQGVTGKLCLFTVVIIMIMNYAGRIQLQPPSVDIEMYIIVNRHGVKYLRRINNSLM